MLKKIILKGGKMSRKIYDKNFKAKVALEALKEEKTLRELSEQYGINPNVISRWKKEVLRIETCQEYCVCKKVKNILLDLITQFY